MTHNSLVASQRPHISLIDRRHFGDAVLPKRRYVKQKGPLIEVEAVVHLLTALSHINVRDYAHRPAREAALDRCRCTSRC